MQTSRSLLQAPLQLEKDLGQLWTDVASSEGSKRNRGEGLPLQSRPDSSRAFTTTLPAPLCPAVEEKTKSLVIIF